MGTNPRRSSDWRHCVWQTPVSCVVPEGAERVGRETASDDAARVTHRDHPMPGEPGALAGAGGHLLANSLLGRRASCPHTGPFL